MTRELTLATGGTGTTGGRVVQRLEARGRRVRAASRHSACALDWDQPGTWEPALAGVTGVYLAYAPDLAVPGAAETLAAFTRCAATAEVHRVVLLSGRGEPGAQAAERSVRAVADAAGLALTVLRCSWFVQNFTEGQFAPALQAGELALPVGDVVEPFLDADDVADAAVEALLADGHAGRTYELTGPRALGFAEAVRECAAAMGRPVTFRPVSPAGFREAMAAEGVPDDVLDLLTHLFTEVLDGRNSRPADGVQQVLGRPPTDLADAVRRSAAAGCWT
ncbi:NmrA family transcriptional regulator [Modestobacter altitudinis]|uniref:NmrA family transcriptional regulator n=1 Tax=Modestobacter altitudinis TaxID=2213158 RepID=UPI00148677DE|nr:NmrA family transcriptional regulator [Modestobacter altitudinis]